ncbi:hypothetical protein H6G80_35715 [Nostoc sp. FACHB-87]|uniref:hypothetical protein n=1 Tax=Nostocales TaxID=1161 RepID=UPI001686DE71|nr:MULTISPECIES: hypothetical protein [Nostocales]MBD2303402.1 hypothetical protein [Nostoc sp. FACHB-190]MBD2459363.1 hypothetical protein [Nostoc sp. FACHB-87]MBD2480361.1 hypothetical protein [Anabaena sp. FACHB-83]MBD2492458.1 hypothetical protein [Aulosira sp. FACHB-615]
MELQKIELSEDWSDVYWSDVYLHTPEERINRLEILLCQKVQRGEDISNCLVALNFLKNRISEQKLEAIFLKRIQFKLAFNSWYRVSQTALAFLLVIACFGSLVKLLTAPSCSLPQITQQHLPQQIPKKELR